MPSFLVEVYAPGVERRAFADVVGRMRGAVRSLADEEIGVRYVGGILVPPNRPASTSSWPPPRMR